MRFIFAIVYTVFTFCAALVPSNAFGQTKFAPRNRPIDVQHYEVILSVDPRKVKDRFDATSTAHVKFIQEADQIEFDAEDLQISRVGWNGEPVTYKQEENFLIVKLPAKQKADSVGELKITYKGKVNQEQSGLFRVTDPDAPERGPLLFTQLEAIGARRFFPCNDEPADKASMDIGASVPKGVDVISSGIMVSDKPDPLRKGWHEVRWSLKDPHSTYLANIAIGPFAKTEKLHGKIPVSVHTAKKALPKANYVLEKNLQAMDFLEKYFYSPYPWPKYSSVGLPTFVWGGMENTSNTFLNQDRMLLHDPKSEEEKLGLAQLTIHELAHQWFGDLVTMKWWDDVWLNEAFATFASDRAIGSVFSKEERDILGAVDLWQGYFRQEDGPRSHPIVRKDLSSPSDAFDGISYTKGSQVLKMLEFYLGEDVFRKAVAVYLKEYAFSNANYVDFFKAIEQSSGKDLKTFRDSWLLQRGYPIISYHTQWDASDRELKITFEQKANHASEDYGFTFRMPVVFHRLTEPRYTQSLTVEFNAKKSRTEILAALPAEPEWITLNPEGTVLAKISTASSGASTEAMCLQVRHDTDAVTRVWAFHELTKPLLDGKTITPEVEQTLSQSLLTEKSPYVRSGMLVAFDKLPAKSLPTVLSQAMVEAFEQTAQKNPVFAEDAHGWELWRTRLLRHLSKVNHPKAYAMIAKSLSNPKASLDEVASSSMAMSSLGDKRSLPALKQAAQTQGKRGYRYRYWVQFALPAFPEPSAIKEIRKLSTTATSDLMGKIPGVIRDNNPLKNSPEWASFLGEFLEKDRKHGVVVKLRFLNTVEDVKTDAVKDLLTKVKNSKLESDIKDSANRILEKNFSG